MTQLEYARKNKISVVMRAIARGEGVSLPFLKRQISLGKVVIPNNNLKTLKTPCGIGQGLTTKVNANIGSSSDKSDIGQELCKLAVALEYKTDTVMDLSIGGDVSGIRKRILARSSVPVGTVPLYQVALNAQKSHGDFLKFDSSDVLEVLETQAREGVDFFTIHSGVSKKSLAALKGNKRVVGIVSRGGAILARWISRYRKENPFYSHFDAILDIAYKYDVTLSLGDGLRPGSVLDANDKGQFSELRILGELADRARGRNVQVMIEGPGHVPLNRIEENIRLQKKFCRGAPFYVLGPLVTDVAPGYDQITSAIGGALAAGYGADFLCYVTPAEHLRHPSVEDVRVGVIASRIAAHAADIVKNPKVALKWDRRMSLARRQRDWLKQIALSIDPKMAREYRKSSQPKQKDVCTMCGTFCSMKMMDDIV